MLASHCNLCTDLSEYLARSAVARGGWYRVEASCGIHARYIEERRWSPRERWSTKHRKPVQLVSRVHLRLIQCIIPPRPPTAAAGWLTTLCTGKRFLRPLRYVPDRIIPDSPRSGHPLSRFIRCSVSSQLPRPTFSSCTLYGEKFGRSYQEDEVIGAPCGRGGWNASAVTPARRRRRLKGEDLYHFVKK